ncbi:MAG: hypothetical protein KJ023_00215 [Burkholderiaceae bacterium]|nr:hypothetical protein [Burkholderiaceae bacterium]
MNIRQVLLDAGLNVFGADLLAESFLKSPIAKQALEKGDPVRFFLPVRRSDCAEFVGVEISIAAVPVEVTANAEFSGPPAPLVEGADLP